MQRTRAKVMPCRAARTPIAAAIFLACPALLAQERGGLEEIIVTAQKRSENLQDVPISIQALGSQTLEELNVKNFNDYVQMLPSVTIQPSIGAGAGFSLVYMRGIATGGDGQATTSQPSVGMYLDEQPITTVQGNLDIHMYDIERVEALAGPQGTLYGASSQAGTIRIITKKPDPSKFASGYSLEGNMVDGDDPGYVAEGFVNLPVSDKAAVRLVGWSRHDAGYIDNVLATRTFTGDLTTTDDDITIDNAQYVEENYNTIDTIGARAALRVELGENWILTPTIQHQKQETEGSWGDDLSTTLVSGKNKVAHFEKEFTDDQWTQYGLTIEGKIGNFDMVYSANYLDRQVDGSFDYSDYAYWYDQAYDYFSSFFFDNNGNPISPSANFTNDDGYTKQSHELRISSPSDKRLRGMLGFFWQEQKHDFVQNFQVTGLADSMQVNYNQDGTRFPDTVYLNNMDRKDTDKAVFASLSFDLTDQVEVTVGTRFFKPEVTVKGFFGYGLGFNPDHAPGTEDGEEAEPGNPANGGEGAFSEDGVWWSKTGEWRCASQASYKDAPCLNVNKGISESEHVSRVNVNWKPNDDYLFYATWSEGYRPGGINRNPFAGDYTSDFLTNYELGWKTIWLDNTLQFNGAVFLEEWEDFQIGFQGANGITQVANGPTADVIGTEVQALWSVTDNLRLSTSMAYYDSELQDDYANYNADGSVDEVLAPKGSPLPLTPEFKGNVVARYEFPLGDFGANLQGAVSYESSRPSDIDLSVNEAAGDLPASTVLDLSAGLERNSWALELFIQNVTDEDAPQAISYECAPGVCASQAYGVRFRPRMIGLKFSQEF
jgi:iron complex outermembrane recepter protein